MANKTLNEKYGIPFGSEWKHKDGGAYMVIDLKHLISGGHKIPVVVYLKILTDTERKDWIKSKIKNQFVRTVEHFKSSFTMKKIKPYSLGYK